MHAVSLFQSYYDRQFRAIGKAVCLQLAANACVDTRKAMFDIDSTSNTADSGGVEVLRLQLPSCRTSYDRQH